MLPWCFQFDSLFPLSVVCFVVIAAVSMPERLSCSVSLKFGESFRFRRSGLVDGRGWSGR